jgi:hypothetical protein
MRLSLLYRVYNNRRYQKTKESTGQLPLCKSNE